jgi:uncharacterized membrane protein
MQIPKRNRRNAPVDQLVPESKQPQDRQALERLVFFSDAVFAIAITILVLDIRLPIIETSTSEYDLFLLLISLWPKYLAFFVSFWVIGFTWISHHRKILCIQRVDDQLLILNLLTLMMIAFMPFPTAVMSENSSFTATSFYAFTMILASLAGLLLWRHATHNHNLISPTLNTHQISRETSVPIVTIVIFAISIGLAFLDPSLARICWILVFPITFFVRGRVA